jgi:Protein of unknown function (DUF3429)
MSVPSEPFADPMKMPIPAMLLGAMGAFPLTTLASAIVFGFKVPGVDLVYALLVYGAIVLSFMGGVHWGLAMLKPGHGAGGRYGHASEWRSYGASIIPALIAWVAVLIPIRFGALVMAVGFVGLLAYDLRCVRLGCAPSWFPSLRWPLTVMAAGSLLVGIVLVGP